MAAKDDTLDSLRDTVDKLYDTTQDKGTTPEIRAAARNEFLEVNHRLMLLMGLDFDQSVAALKKQAAGLSEAKAELDAVLANVKKAVDLVKGVTSFLKGVDAFIDTAKKYVLPLV